VKVKDRLGKKVVLGTSVLDAGALSDHAAATLYRLRWGVRCATARSSRRLRRAQAAERLARAAVLELHWTLLG